MPPVGRILRRDAILTQFVPAIVVFIVLILLALVSWQSTERTLQAQQSHALYEDRALIESALSERMSGTSILIRAGNGLFDASDMVDNAEWHRFFEAFGAGGRYQGIDIVGYGPVVREDERQSLIQELKDIHGSSVTMYPGGSRDMHVPVMFAHVYDGPDRQPYGYDMYADPVRRDAMNKARDTGKVMMTDIVTLVGSDLNGFIIYIPVYLRGVELDTVEQRREALRGFVYAAVRTSDLFAGMQIRDRDSFGYTVEAMSDGKGEVIFASGYVRDTEDPGEPKATSRMRQYGKEWKLAYYSNANLVSPAESAQPKNVLIAGVVLSLMVSASVFFLIKYRTRMLAVTEEQKLQQAKDELLSLASHQLRTPATGVKQYVGMVLDGFGGNLKNEQVKLLEQAYRSNERQLQIINEFLYVAKLGSGSLMTTRHEFDLVPVIRDIYDEMKSEIKERHHEVKLKMPRRLVVFADQHSIRMVIENLLSNAVKYTPPGGEIGVKVSRTPKDIQVDIIDTGVGVAKNDRAMLFKQFSRIPNEMSSEVGGSGIGLYLAEQLAIRNGGHITVESELDKGSTFTLHLPHKKVRKITKNRRTS